MEPSAALCGCYVNKAFHSPGRNVACSSYVCHRNIIGKKNGICLNVISRRLGGGEVALSNINSPCEISELGRMFASFPRTGTFLHRLRRTFNYKNALVYQLMPTRSSAPRQSRLISAVLWMRYKWDVSSDRLAASLTDTWGSESPLPSCRAIRNKEGKRAKLSVSFCFSVVVAVLFFFLLSPHHAAERHQGWIKQHRSVFCLGTSQQMRHTRAVSQYLKTKGKGFFATLAMEGAA